MSDHSNEVMVISDDDGSSKDESVNGAGAAEGSSIHPVPELAVGEDHPAPELEGAVKIHPVPEEIEVIEIDSDNSNSNSNSSSVQIVHPVPPIVFQLHFVPQIGYQLHPVPQIGVEAPHPVPDQEIELIIIVDSDSDNEHGHGQHNVVANNNVVVEELPALPASPAAVEALPEAPVNEDKALSACAVCREVFAAGELAVWLPCNHYFHGDCIRPWLAIRDTCPVCRGQLPRNDAAAGGADDQGAAPQA
ncbi:E3 ubiquitin-protein ligase RNF38 [Brachypodium distachyon]|uniref:RING-type domain-containing protein n=1 Tax=Brachypodium distachyon TaxID=15368 RepID=I1HY68_BRADI|nr:E3 ubiquitin-protein ligase RNF38 [Brachypodium distachyon]KQJ93775.1 hypothetical protein BRADI_3g06660v3 [Brachypodium distachyon]|eukprot:XP_010236306.1 E3 ubiquitin-protein ligase RNF38 [Brachypodium distachyon]